MNVMNTMMNTKSFACWIVLVGFMLAAVPRAGAAEPGNPGEARESGGPGESAAAAAGVKAAEGLEVTRWAVAPMLASPVSISLDNMGRAYVTQTVRRKASAPDIRQHWEWVTADLGLRTIDQKEAFLREQLATSRSDENQDWPEDYNKDGVHDWRDLTVNSEKVHLIEDTDGDGVADQSTLFAEGFDSVVTGVAAGVLWHDGAVYVTAAPDMWKLRDTDNDGRADQRRSLSHGYGLHIGYAGHDMSGLTVGPDGKIYWSIGDLGVNVTTEDGQKFVYPNHGAVMRCNPDGSDFEVFAHGLRNPQELAFDEHGNLFSVDNDSDKPNDRERIVYITQGSDSGWRSNWQYIEGGYNPWLAEKLYAPRFEGQAAYITPPVAQYMDGPCGFTYNPGTALSAEYDHHFFVTNFTGTAERGTVMAFELKQNGATFELVDDREVVRGVLPTGITFGPAGALYVCDWIGGWNVHDRGRVWKIDAATVGAERSRLRAETAGLLAEGMGERPTGELSQLLGHEDMRVRMGAQFELVERGGEGARALLAAARGAEDPLARLHGIWGIGQIGREEAAAVKPLVGLLGDEDAEVRAQAAKVIGEAEYEPAMDEVLGLLDDQSERVRFFAAMTLGDLGDAEAFDPLVTMLEVNDGESAYLRHAGVMGLVGTGGDGDALVRLADHESRAVRLAAVVGLRRLEHEGVAAFLGDEDEQIAAEAARAIHDDFSIPAAMGPLAESLEREGLSNAALLRRAINANLRLNDESNARRLARYAANPAAPEAMRVEAIESLAVWAHPPVLGRVEYRNRPMEDRDVAIVHGAIEPVVGSLLKDESEAVRVAAAGMVGELKYRGEGEALYAIVADAEQPVGARLAALKALGEVRDEKLSDAVALAMKAGDEDLRNEARRLLAVIEPTGEAAVGVLAEAVEEGTLTEKQGALAALGGMHTPAADAVLGRWMDRLLAGEAPAGIQLDLLRAAERSESATVAAKVKRYHQSRPKDDPLAAWTQTLHGGDAEAGRKIVYENVVAQCIRCHRIDGQGGQVAPDLSEIGSRADRRYLLESLVDPNATIAEGYGMVALELEDGTTLAGTLRGESEDVVTLGVTKDNVTFETRRVPTSQIVSRTPALSAMPPMGTILTKTQIRDVVEYLAGLK